MLTTHKELTKSLNYFQHHGMLRVQDGGNDIQISPKFISQIGTMQNKADIYDCRPLSFEHMVILYMFPKKRMTMDDPEMLKMYKRARIISEIIKAQLIEPMAKAFSNIASKPGRSRAKYDILNAIRDSAPTHLKSVEIRETISQIQVMNEKKNTPNNNRQSTILKRRLTTLATASMMYSNLAKLNEARARIISYRQTATQQE